jgi:hypothetical protein
MFVIQGSALASLLFAGVIAGTAQTSPAVLPANYIHVDAPTAQRLVVAEKNAHPEIVKLGLHAKPAAAKENVIIANDVTTKIGKISSAPDMQKLALGKAVAVRIEKDSIYDLFLPITDASGGDLDGGFLVMEVPFAKVSSEADALKIGVVIRDELQSQITSKAALYQR